MAKNLNRTIKFTTRLNSKERKILDREAKKENVTPSQLIRMFIYRIENRK